MAAVVLRFYGRVASLCVAQYNLLNLGVGSHFLKSERMSIVVLCENPILIMISNVFS